MLAGPVLADKNSLTDIGIMIGAAVAAALGGTWALHRGIPWRTALAAGARRSADGHRRATGRRLQHRRLPGGHRLGQPHGWIWGAVALVGTWAGLRLRPLFGLGNPKPGDGVC